MKHIPHKRQTLFFSATISKKIKSLAYDVVRNAIRIQISPKNPVAKTISHSILEVEMDDKRFFLENIIKENPEMKMVVFVRTKVRVERVVAAMERVQIQSEALHGGLEQKDRFAILDRFRSGENKILITTDVACRGIDIPDVDYVINYDIPNKKENYTESKESTEINDAADANRQAGQMASQRPQVTETIVRDTPKINRNDTVTIKHIMSGKTESMKYKKAESLIAKGEWVLV